MLARQVVQATDYTHSQMIEHLLKVRSRRFRRYCRNRYFVNITIIIIVIIIIIVMFIVYTIITTSSWSCENYFALRAFKTISNFFMIEF